VEPLVPDTTSVRAWLWVLLAVAALFELRAPSAPGPLALVRDASGCRLGLAGSAPACECRELPVDARMALGLPLPLNAANATELERVPGLGPARAHAILAERESGGAFASLEALSTRVPGIGRKTVDRIRPHLFAVGPDPACGVGRES
jgi:competence ComEA-like helix-hairpin-helix protein